MKEMSQVHSPATSPKPTRDAMPVEPVGAISEVDFDKVSGGGGLSGGVVGSRGPCRGN